MIDHHNKISFAINEYKNEAVFTYNNIPTECLTKLNKIDFLNNVT